ncbi:MAG TPA: hemolysin III family protein [Candidatus Aminicenantes bacterium]|nr:hemolysin III family protein [Candidatus Aminicenantes bacterium]
MKEETINAVTHGAGAVLGAAGLAVLVALAALRGDAWHVVSCAIYGATLVLLFTSSTLYHSFRGPRVKHVFRVIDHSSIYLLIAGTYTPFLLVSLRGGWGWSLFGVVWGLALAGIAFQVFFVDRFRLAQTLIYLGMGWLVVVATRPLLQRVPLGGLLWLLAGGLSYTLGAVFYLWKKLPYHHGIWHLFVLAGSVCHYFAILLYVIP